MKRAAIVIAAAVTLCSSVASAQKTQKPVIHAKEWIAITGKPLAATAGAMMYQRGGNAVDSACAMLAATSTMWDTLGWGGETQALIYNPKTKKVIGINALGVAPTGATAELYKSRNFKYPPEHGPLAAVTPGTPGGLLVMLAEYGKLSLKDVLAPAISLADGYPMDVETSAVIERNKDKLKQWPYSKAVMLPHSGERAEGPRPGEMFRQPDLAATLRKLVEAEQQAIKKGRNRRDSIMAAYDRFYRGDIAEELARSTQEQGGLITVEDLARWKVIIEEPTTTNYRGIDVYKLREWTQGPVLLQALNVLENFDLKAMGYNSPRYIHTLYQAMNLTFADRDFYYGDPYFPPAEPMRGLLSKAYAKERAKLINPDRNDPAIAPGDPYPFQNETNPFGELLKEWIAQRAKAAGGQSSFFGGTTSVEAADAEGWVVSITPSGGWIPAVIAGKSGVGLSQRAQSFVLQASDGPFNVIEPGKRPRVTLTPSLALKDGKPLLAFAVQGGDSQDQNLLQFFLNVVEFGMNVQEAAEAANINSFQMRSSFGAHDIQPGKMQVSEQLPAWSRRELRRMGYELTFVERASGPITAILFDQTHGTMWGGASHHGDDYGIGW